MASQRCILGAVVLLCVSVCSVAADPALGQVSAESEKLPGVDPKPDPDLDQNLDPDPDLDSDPEQDPEGGWDQDEGDAVDSDEELDDSEGLDPDDPEGLDPDDSEGLDPDDPEGLDPDDSEGLDPDDPEGLDPDDPEGLDPDDPEDSEESLDPDNPEDSQDSNDEDSNDEDSNDEDSNDEDSQDNLSVAERLELVNKDLEGDQENVLEDGDVAVPRHHRQKRNAARCTRRRCAWPRRRNRRVYVPYVIARHYSAAQIRTIKQAFRTFARKTCIRFVCNVKQKRRWRYRDYLYIHSSRGCWSYIGRRGGRQKLSLQRNGCVHLGIIQHELLHALGFHHEHNRSDRDRYVRVLWGNIKKGKKGNFRKTRTLNLGSPYDYGSIMHYGKNAFSKNGRPTLVARRCNVTFGKARSMSVWDIRRVNRLYCR